MLVLSRRQEQKIQIGDNVVVTILQVKGRAVRIGIEAPPEMHIKRGELSDDPPSESTVRAEQSESSSTQSHLVVTRRRDRVLAKRRSPAFARRRTSSGLNEGPLDRFVRQRHPRDPRSESNPAPRSDEAGPLVPLGCEVTCEAIVDRSPIELHLDPYHQAPALGHGRQNRFYDAEESPVVRALRWRF